MTIDGRQVRMGYGVLKRLTEAIMTESFASFPACAGIVVVFDPAPSPTEDALLLMGSVDESRSGTHEILLADRHAAFGEIARMLRAHDDDHLEPLPTVPYPR